MLSDSSSCSSTDCIVILDDSKETHHRNGHTVAFVGCHGFALSAACSGLSIKLKDEVRNGLPVRPKAKGRTSKDDKETQKRPA